MINLLNIKTLSYISLAFVIAFMLLWTNKLRHEVQHLNDELTICKKDINAQNLAVRQLKITQEQEEEYKSQFEKLAGEKFVLELASHDSLQAPEDCDGAIKWGINKAKDFK